MFKKPEARPDFPALEEEILRMWEERDVFARSIRGEKDFVFYDGPPFATGTPHYGHLLAGTLKDVVPRYWAMRGFRVERRFGWDTHGLPVEMEIEKDLGLNGPDEVAAYGVDKYNEACRSIVLRYTDLWRATVTRLGRWVDFDNDYKTMDPSFMESVWWVFKTLWDKGLIYEGYKVMPYSWRLGTPLSNFEANMDYRKVQDPAVTIGLPVKDDPDTVLLAWTTTPWTLPSNMALCVGADITYAKVRGEDGKTYVVAEALKTTVMGEEAEVLGTCTGADLVGLHYIPLFDHFADAADEGAYRVVADDYVTTDSGTGIVHQAPAFGEDDWRVCEREGVPMRDATDMQGRFTAVFPLAEGQLVKDADKAIIRDLKDRGRLFHQATIDHDYPFCWRSGTPLIYKAISTWFVRVSDIKDRMAAHNQTTNWVPDYVGERRFHNWLSDARDWAISRSRFWGTPLPIWRCTDCDELFVCGSIADLEANCGESVPDLHKHFVDEHTWDCGCGGTMKRVPEVLDCWFESGSMPYAQNHYPFENKELVENNLPADFIAEGLDQTRGWFYTLLVLSTALFDRPAFKNVIVNGLILAEDGRKMSKSLKNYPDPNEVVNEHGADALRAYLINSPVVRAEPSRFVERGVRDVVRSVILPLWNAAGFFTTYAAADGWTPPTTPSAIADRPLMDRWIISMTQSLVQDVNQEMEAYRLYNVIPRVLGFIDDLTNWYIRRCRRRFWHSDDPVDQGYAFETLYAVLCTFSRLLAPILPFMAELLYQRLEAGVREGAEDSVHLEHFPEAQPEYVDLNLEAAMSVMRDVVTVGRNLREQHRIKVRQPLPGIRVATSANLESAIRDSLTDVVREELNVKSVTWVSDPATLVKVSAKANFKVLGPLLGPRMKPVAMAIGQLGADDVRALMDGQTLSIEGESITAEHVMIVQETTGDGAVESQGNVTVELDTNISAELHLEGLARELVSRIQAARKDTGLEVEDRIVLSLRTESADLRNAIQAHQAMVCAEVLATELRDLDVPHAEVKAGDEPVGIGIARV